MAPPAHTVVIDMGSNSFRLVVYSFEKRRWWKRTDEMYDTVGIGAGLATSGRLAKERIAHALYVAELYAHYCRASGLPLAEAQPVATSAIRDATNGREFVKQVRAATGLPVEILSTEQEAYYGYLAAVNSTTLDDGAVLDLGGGSLQLVEVADRRMRDVSSWPLGTVRMTEQFLSRKDEDRAALRDHAMTELASAGWLTDCGRRLVGMGGTVRNLAAAAQHAAGLPSLGVQGFALTRDALDKLVEELAARPPGKRGAVPGIKPGRARIILAGAIVLAAVMDAGGFDAIEVTEEGLREGVFFASYLAPADPPLFADVRAASVRNLAAQYQSDLSHPEHVARLCDQLLDSLAASAEPPVACAAGELLHAAAMLHDIGMAVDYDDHHKHSRYLILAAGLPGFTPRELALVAQTVRYHRKGNPDLGELAALAKKGDETLVLQLAALLRLAEHLDRARDGVVSQARLHAAGNGAQLLLEAHGDESLARWGAEQQADLFERAFGSPLSVG
jgi:exopolyphosphatase/guanosine-5'-triphosphate,3'-diphosphate pyrophosphatase